MKNFPESFNTAHCISRWFFLRKIPGRIFLSWAETISANVRWKMFFWFRGFDGEVYEIWERNYTWIVLKVGQCTQLKQFQSFNNLFKFLNQLKSIFVLKYILGSFLASLQNLIAPLRSLQKSFRNSTSNVITTIFCFSCSCWWKIGVWVSDGDGL